MKLQFFVVLLILIAAPVQAAERYKQRTALPDHVNLPPLIAFLDGSWITSDPSASATETWFYDQSHNRVLGMRITKQPADYQTFLVEGDGVKMREMRNEFLAEPTVRFLGGINSKCTNRANLTVWSLREKTKISFNYDSPSPDKLDLEMTFENADGKTTTKIYHYKRANPVTPAISE